MNIRGMRCLFSFSREENTTCNKHGVEVCWLVGLLRCFALAGAYCVAMSWDGWVLALWKEQNRDKWALTARNDMIAGFRVTTKINPRIYLLSLVLMSCFWNSSLSMLHMFLVPILLGQAQIQTLNTYKSLAPKDPRAAISLWWRWVKKQDRFYTWTVWLLCMFRPRWLVRGEWSARLIWPLGGMEVI